MSYTCSSPSPFVKVSKKCQKSVTKDFEIFPGGNGSVSLAVNILRISTANLLKTFLNVGVTIVFTCVNIHSHKPMGNIDLINNYSTNARWI